MMKEEKETSISEIIKNWAAQSTSHGIPKIASSPYKIIKIMWIIFFTASFGFCGFCLFNSFQDFLKFAVNTQMSVVTVSSLQFPTITFCNMHAFKTNDPEFPYKNIFSIFFNKMVGISKNGPQKFDDLQKVTLGLDQATKSFIYSEKENELNRSTLSYTIDEMLISCSFNLINCSKEDFDYYWSNTYGNCYQFNTGKKSPPKTSTFPGRLNGLKLDLYASKPKNDLAFTKSNGIIVFIHNSYDIPLMITEGVTLPTGFETEIAINQMIVKRLPSPYDNCVEDFDSQLYKKTIVLNSNVYRQKFCLVLCLEEYLIKKCGCYEINSFKIPYSRLCNLTEISNCLYFESIKFYNGIESSKCLDECPQECESTIFNIKTYQSNFPTPYYADLIMNYADNSIRNLTSIEQIRETSLAVNIYFNELTNTTIEEQPNKTPVQLVSDIGGSLGLFIGISLLSIAEIFELILELLIYCMSAKNKKVSNSDALFVHKM